MAAPTVEKTDVRRALEHFAAQGVRAPGLLRLQRQIGRGSLPRIKKLLTEIQNEQLAPLIPGAKAPPDAIAAQVAAIWAEFEQALAEREQELEASVVEQREQLAVENRQALAARDETQERAEALEGELATEREHTAALAARAEELARTLAEREAELAGERKVVEALRESKQELTTAMVKAEQKAAERVRYLTEQLEQLQTGRLELELRHERERAESAKALADLREIVTFQRDEAERQRTGYEKALAGRDARLRVAESALEENVCALVQAEEQAKDLSRENRALQDVVDRQLEEISRGAERAIRDGERITVLEKALDDAKARGSR